MLCLAISLVRSIKLKPVFAVLGKLVQLVTTNPGSSHEGPWNTVLTPDKQNSDQAFPHFFDPNRATSDVTHAAPLQIIETRSSRRQSRLERRSWLDDCFDGVEIGEFDRKDPAVHHHNHYVYCDELEHDLSRVQPFLLHRSRDPGFVCN